MTELQKSFLNTLLEPSQIYRKQKLWAFNFHAPFCFFIISAKVQITVFKNKRPFLVITNDENYVEMDVAVK